MASGAAIASTSRPIASRERRRGRGTCRCEDQPKRGADSACRSAVASACANSIDSGLVGSLACAAEGLLDDVDAGHAPAGSASSTPQHAYASSEVERRTVLATWAVRRPTSFRSLPANGGALEVFAWTGNRIAQRQPTVHRADGTGGATWHLAIGPNFIALAGGGSSTQGQTSQDANVDGERGGAPGAGDRGAGAASAGLSRRGAPVRACRGGSGLVLGVGAGARSRRGG